MCYHIACRAFEERNPAGELCEKQFIKGDWDWRCENSVNNNSFTEFSQYPQGFCYHFLDALECVGGGKDLDSLKDIESNKVDKRSLENYLQTKGKNHNYFKYYSSRERIEAIIQESALFLSDGNNWNDKCDYVSFNSDDQDYVRFGLCMSFMKSESVAMWMLYAKNNGMMIDFGGNFMREVLKTKVVQMGWWNNGKFMNQKSLTLVSAYS